jgi:putative Holliday junction resolvase
MRIMAIDYGEARTGVAVSDALGMLAGYTTVIQSWNREKVVEELVRLAGEHQAGELVLGYPKNMNNTLGEKAQTCAALAEELRERTGLPVVLWDERLTTVDAHRILHANGRKTKKHRQNVDAVAATLILEGYLARKNGGL